MDYRREGRAVVKNPVLLAEELARLGLKPEFHDEPVRLRGCRGAAEVVVRGASNDIGFARRGEEYVPVVSDYDRHRFNRRWVNRVIAHTWARSVLALAAERGDRVLSHTVDANRIKIEIEIKEEAQPPN